jgi:hypothetical protein
VVRLASPDKTPLREPRKIEDYREDRAYLDVDEAQLLEAWDEREAEVVRLRQERDEYRVQASDARAAYGDQVLVVERLREALREREAMLDMYALQEAIPPGYDALYFAGLVAAHKMNALVASPDKPPAPETFTRDQGLRSSWLVGGEER